MRYVFYFTIRKRLVSFILANNLESFAGNSTQHIPFKRSTNIYGNENMSNECTPTSVQEVHVHRKSRGLVQSNINRTPLSNLTNCEF